MLAALHGTSLIKMLIILWLNWRIARIALNEEKGIMVRREWVPYLTWGFNVGMLFMNSIYGGYEFGSISSTLNWLVSRDHFFEKSSSYDWLFLRRVCFGFRTSTKVCYRDGRSCGISQCWESSRSIWNSIGRQSQQALPLPQYVFPFLPFSLLYLISSIHRSHSLHALSSNRRQSPPIPSRTTSHSLYSSPTSSTHLSTSQVQSYLTHPISPNSFPPPPHPSRMMKPPSLRSFDTVSDSWRV